MSDLESRYRAVLRCYPTAWRSVHADVVVGTLLDQADAENRQQPRGAELVNLTLNGIRTRLVSAITISRVFRDQLAALALGTGFAVMAIMLLGYEWAPFADERYWPAVFGPFLSAAVIVNFLWIAAFGLALATRWGWARAVLISVIVASIAAVLLIEATPLLYARPPASALALVVVLGVLALAGSPSRRSLSVSALAAAALFIGLSMLQYETNGWTFMGFFGWGWYITANGWWTFALLLVVGFLIAIRQPKWVASITAFSAIWGLYSIGTSYTNHSDVSVAFFGLATMTLAVAIVAVTSALLTGYRLQVVRPIRT